MFPRLTTAALTVTSIIVLACSSDHEPAKAHTNPGKTTTPGKTMGTDDGEHDVEAERHGHLQPCSEQVRHAQLCRLHCGNLPLLK